MTRKILLSAEEKETLESIRDSHPAAYMRERAAAVLKVAGGMSANAVARHGLLRERKADAVHKWLDRWEEGGAEGLEAGQGRGRKVRRPPTEAELGRLRDMLRETPRRHGIPKDRWTARDIRNECEWLREYSESGAWRVLKRHKALPR